MKLYKLFFMCIFMVLSVFVFAGGIQGIFAFGKD